MIFMGDDWSEDHHDVYLMDQAGKRLASRRLPEGLTGIRQLHELIAAHVEDPEQVVIGIETDRGPWVGALTAAGYQVYAINPLAVAHYRDRHHGYRLSPLTVWTSVGWMSTTVTRRSSFCSSSSCLAIGARA